MTTAVHNTGTTGYSNTYCEARFYRPTGLGNRLFSWARAKVFSRQTGCKMLSPDWAHLRGASILRGGIDYSNAPRKILLFDNFMAAPGEVKGLAKIMLRKQCTVLPVTTLQEALSVLHTGNNRRLVSFAGHTAHVFDDLWIHREIIFSSLISITKQKWRPRAATYRQPFIGINVRMGNDFKKVSGRSDFLNSKALYLQTPLDWYVDSLRKVREITGKNYPAMVISDGSEKDLHLLLKEPGVFYGGSRSAIGDLLILANATVLIGAGGSSFSAWASFLAKIPTITIPGADLQGYHVSNNMQQHYVGEFDPDHPPEAFYAAVRKQTAT